MKKLMVMMLGLSMIFTLSACGQKSADTERATTAARESQTDSNVSELLVTFGEGGTPYTLHLEDNETAQQVADYVGRQSWNLPIYHFDDYENYEVMQYYDVASSYEFTSNPETITTEKGGEVYYSDPNRIVLFYQDAEITGEYTKIGYIDYSEEFYEAVANNPVLAGWGNKIVSISAKR